MVIDYLVVGNPSLDRSPDGTVVAGGTLVYAAVQAARLGRHVRAVGRGDPGELARVLPTSDLISWDIQPAPVSTAFTNVSEGSERQQIISSSAGVIDDAAIGFDARIVHIGPIDAEVDLDAMCARIPSDPFVGVTPQGLYRTWGDDGLVRLRAVPIADVTAERIDAVVVGHNEVGVAAPLLDAVARAGGVAIVTRGDAGCEVRFDGRAEVVPGVASVRAVDTTGAGDVFATALFLALADGAPTYDAVCFAQAAAAASVRGRGITGIADRAEIMTLLD